LPGFLHRDFTRLSSAGKKEAGPVESGPAFGKANVREKTSAVSSGERA